MRLRNGILTIVFGTLLITAALLLAYYNLFLSNATATEFETLQTDLDNECALFASQLPLQQDISRYLDVQAGRTGYQFHLLNLEGQTLYRTAEQNEPAISINATSPLQFNGQTILLRVTKFISIKTATSIPAVQRLLLAGIVILLITLPIIYLVLYLYYVRPIVRLQRDMEQYKSGEKPVGSKRRDEIGKLQNAFVQLTDDLDLEKQKQNRLIASISHDIKTPLTSVMGYAERLQNNTLSPERSKRYIATIYEKAQRIRDLVDEFDDYLSCNMPGTLKKQTVTTNRLFALFEEEYQQELSELGVSLT
ncbi:MAG: histidine kinase dimerization/phospho-acceptor domain-containing protein, partial [Acutalibacteraceae bacterium]